MLNAEISFWIFLALSLAVAAYSGWRFGKQVVLGVGMACSLLAASWFEINVAGLPISVPLATAAVLLIAFVIHSGKQIWSTMTALDLLMIALVIWHVMVDVYHGSDFVRTAVTSYGEWAVPYVAGRYAFLHRGSLTNLSPWFAGIAAIIAIGAAVESLTSINVWESLLAEKDSRVDFFEMIRYDLAQRAHGTTRHAIFFGVLLLSMIPWPIAMLDSAGSDKTQKMIAGGLLAAIIVGILATLSRGPVMAVVLAGILLLSYQYPIIRWGSLVAFVLGTFVVFTFPNQSISLFDSEPNRETHSTIIQLDEDSEAQIYSGTRNRLFVVKIYGPLVIKGGMVGYGTVASEGFPPTNLPGLPSDPAALEAIGIVDNSFINVGLRFGLVGMGLFLLCFATAVATAFLLARDASTYFYPHSGITLAAIGSIVAAAGVELLTVYFDRDHGFWIIFMFGVVSGLQASTKLAWPSET